MEPNPIPRASTERRPTLGDLITLIRPQQWYKNLIVFAGLIFSLSFFDLDAVLRTLAGFLIFCLASGGVYALNDVVDAERDRHHPKKQSRPVASRRISPVVASVFGMFLILAALALASVVQMAFAVVLVGYLLLQAVYVPVLKNHVFLDLFCIAFGLILRAIAGVVLIDVYLSPWLLLCTFFLALFLGLGKRRSEVKELGSNAMHHRANLAFYSEPLLNQSLTVVMAAIVLSYSMYTFFHENQWMMVTIPFVLYGIFRYLFLEIEHEQGGEPEAIFRDPISVANLLLWGLTVIVVLALGSERLTAFWVDLA